MEGSSLGLRRLRKEMSWLVGDGWGGWAILRSTRRKVLLMGWLLRGNFEAVKGKRWMGWCLRMAGVDKEGMDIIMDCPAGNRFEGLALFDYNAVSAIIRTTPDLNPPHQPTTNFNGCPTAGLVAIWA